jgi:pilus assembly protein Flp/PilA
MIRLFGGVLRETRGATAIEYGLILALVVLALMAGLLVLANSSLTMWSHVSDEVVSAGN